MIAPKKALPVPLRISPLASPFQELLQIIHFTQSHPFVRGILRLTVCYTVTKTIYKSLLSAYPPSSRDSIKSVLVAPFNMEQVWFELCKEIQVPEAVATKWWSRIQANYSSSNRSFHNERVMFLTHKLPYLKGHKDSAVTLACIFQYLEFRPNMDSSQENCDLFREFASDAGLSSENQVSSSFA